MKIQQIQHATNLQPGVLLVSDQAANQGMLIEILESGGYKVETAENSRDACQLLENKNNQCQAVLLDLMMPGPDGSEVLLHIRQCPHLAKIPVIFQSAAGRVDIRTDLDTDVLYCLSRPFSKNQLLAIVDSAIARYVKYKDLCGRLVTQTPLQFYEGEFLFSSIDEACNTASLLASLCPEPERVVLGLSELFFNAIEHGHLAIAYQEKLSLIAENRWLVELDNRLQLSENKDKKVKVIARDEGDAIYFEIEDEGEGFDYRHCLVFNEEQATNRHGRGIAIAKALSFDELEYQGNGSQVRLKVSVL